LRGVTLYYIWFQSVLSAHGEHYLEPSERTDRAVSPERRHDNHGQTPEPGGRLDGLGSELTAPIEFRIEQIRARHGLSDIAARDYIEEVDKARSRRLMAMFGADWRDPNRYDLILNMGTMRREGAKHMIVEAAKLEEYRPTPESNQAFNDFALTSRVHATLFAAPNVRASAVEVRAEGSHIHVKGRVEQGSENQLVKIVKNVPGVTAVTSHIYSGPPEGFLQL
jgi:cytidylate kinase-like protein/BON domain-containing protein